MKHQASKLEQMAQTKGRKKEQRAKDDSCIKFVTISSGKGGVGKSTIAANLGYVLSQNKIKTVLLDADIGLANLDIMLNQRSSKNILHILKGEASLKEVIVTINDYLALIPGDNGEEILEYADALLLPPFLEAMETLNDYQVMLIDTGAGIGKHLSPFIEATDYPIVVITPDPASIADAYAMIKKIAKVHHHIYLIINQVETIEQGQVVFNKISKLANAQISNELKLSLLGSLDNNQIIYNSIRKRKLFIENSQLSQTSIPFMRIIAKNLSRKMKMEHDMIDTSSNRIQGFFKRVFSGFDM